MSMVMLNLLLMFVFIYMIIPYVITRIWGFGVTLRGRRGRQIAFTFDDGPDPLHTPKLLDLLKKKRIKVTFFVLGSKAERYPELMKRIHMEGHQIGIHNYSHLPNWLMSPRHIRNKHVHRSADIIERITGERPAFYRPPWGILNLGDLFALRKYRIVLWSIMGWDWGKGSKNKPLKERILDQLEPGSIILLHDSGDTWGAEPDAPSRMIASLEEVIDTVHIQGYECVRADELLHKPHDSRSDLSKGFRVG
ncbi:polysaccharide deacetylase family protein [Paenibacillus sp. HGF5]|uniref:polysaccharide deacetylase family protein n=1 Tax=Paenibacillus sp. HGF5 TaxID=908341 RepID=UPI0002072ABC|nr:polysaccharide deacetylase family protein [Paenibacillus sp. HGF5]EGG33341.1 polysaccharide deacetylase [Paenibacillus sp. HGF5]